MAAINKQATYFKQVASVIGEDAAEVELLRVIDSGIAFDDIDGTTPINGVFIFMESPQGFSFWDGISRDCGLRSVDC